MKKLIDYFAKRFAEALADGLKVQMFQIAKADLKPGDKIILRTQNELSDLAYEHLQNSMKAHFPGHDVIILEEGLDIGFIGSQEK